MELFGLILTHLDQFRPSCTNLDLFGGILGHLGPFRTILACLDLLKPFWYYLKVFGPIGNWFWSIWTHLDPIGPILTHNYLFGPNWTHLHTFAPIFSRVYPYGPIFTYWTYFDQFDAIWSYLINWIYLELFGHILTHFDQFGPTIPPLVQYTFYLWIIHPPPPPPLKGEEFAKK